MKNRGDSLMNHDGASRKARKKDLQERHCEHALDIEASPSESRRLGRTPFQYQGCQDRNSGKTLWSNSNLG
eukprot:CAMPEP_0171816700 /NCGR_PEP_ID=MMETSP0992-20121227/659_1 /TAXON_ID=483369 /ORGANISM="non described non described, Strain CCMP2098" /LENGTH=70 /DNA_ID=CAMNT_0012430613 /DNA_START=1824 /DNA_END=2036 /DNA_ORIENTATION=-